MNSLSCHAAEGFQLVQAGRPEDAVARFQEGLEADPADAGCLLGLARVHLLSDDLKGAVPFLRRLLGVHPDSSEAKSHLALLRFEEGDEAALRELRDAAEAPGAGVYEPLNLGTALSRARDASGAADAFSRAIRNEPGSPFPRLIAAEAALAQGDAASAVRYLEPAVARSPGEVALLAMLGDAYRGAGEPAKASEAIARACALEPENAGLLAARYDCAAQLGHWKDARTAAARLCELAPDDVEYRYRLGRALAYEGRLEEARDVLEDVLAREKAAPEPRQVLADVLAQLGDHGRARALLEEAVRLAPTDPGPANDLANLYLADPGGSAKAAQVLEPVLQAHPDDPVTHFNLALALSRSDVARALEHARSVEVSGHPQLAPEAALLIRALSKSA